MQTDKEKLKNTLIKAISDELIVKKKLNDYTRMISDDTGKDNLQTRIKAIIIKYNVPPLILTKEIDELEYIVFGKSCAVVLSQSSTWQISKAHY